MANLLPNDPQSRKELPIFSGVLKYFPRAIAYIAHVSKVGNDQHNPGEPLHWDREKSTDHLDSCVRHLMETGTVDGDGVRHSGKAAWRALAHLETELEDADYSQNPDDPNVLTQWLDDFIMSEASKPIEISPLWKKLGTSRPLVIYVAGPYRDADLDVVRDNISRADYWGRRLRAMGHHPIVPHTMTQSWDGQFTFEQIMDTDLRILARCDALLYLGHSEGARMEKEQAVALGLPVFTPSNLPPNLTGVD